MLEVQSVDWHLLENGRAHHTDRYEILHEEATPVLRRAQPFKITLTFRNRPFNQAVDNVRLLFKLDNGKDEPRLESVIEDMTVTTANKLIDSKKLWSLRLEAQSERSVTLQVRSPPEAAWGTWNLSVKVSLKLDPKSVVWRCPTAFWLLFNPWNKDDDVYMPETKYLDEYILSDVGKVYTKGVGTPIGLKWIYGQFASPILKVLKTLLDINENLDQAKRSSPVEICKALGRVNRIIEGNWSDNFDGGTKPWLWTGSVPIYKEYLTTGRSAKYAQCYVYAAIFTTALRAAGIPGRNVSNFVSATEGFDTMSLNYVYDASGEVVDSPMIWNFHVWNDAWMARHDLPLGYGGWQAVDAGHIGPAPVQAIKKGEICLPFDVKYIFSECNSDRARWTKDDSGEYHLVKIDPSYVGRAMLTKQPFIYDPHGDTDFMDLIEEYKEKEGSREERLAVYNAIKHCKRMNKTLEEELEEMDEDEAEYYYGFSSLLYTVDIPLEQSTLSFHLRQLDSVLFGEPLRAVLVVENSGDEAATVEACLGSSSIHYNSATAALIKRQRETHTVQAKSKKEVTLVISSEDYAAKLVEFTLVKVHCLATVKESNYVWADDFQLHVDMPEIIITAKGDLQENKEGILLFQLKNLLKRKLTNSSITYEAPGIGRNIKFPCRDVKAEETITIEHKVKPDASGEILINANFNSKELNFLAGSAFLEVLPL